MSTWTEEANELTSKLREMLLPENRTKRMNLNRIIRWDDAIEELDQVIKEIEDKEGSS